MPSTAGPAECRSSSEPEISKHVSEQALTRWQKVENIIWDGGERSEEERRLVRRLDIFIMFVYLERLMCGLVEC